MIESVLINFVNFLTMFSPRPPTIPRTAKIKFSQYFVLQAGSQYEAKAARSLFAGVSWASWHF